jgi:hypothetical protein
LYRTVWPGGADQEGIWAITDELLSGLGFSGFWIGMFRGGWFGCLIGLRPPWWAYAFTASMILGSILGAYLEA